MSTIRRFYSKLADPDEGGLNGLPAKTSGESHVSEDLVNRFLTQQERSLVLQEKQMDQNHEVNLLNANQALDIAKLQANVIHESTTATTKRSTLLSVMIVVILLIVVVFLGYLAHLGQGELVKFVVTHIAAVAMGGLGGYGIGSLKRNANEDEDED